MKIKYLIISFSFLLIGCVPMYQPVNLGPKAKITLNSPTLEWKLLVNVDLNLIMYKANNACEFEPIGKIVLNPGEEPVSTYIPAEERAYIRVEYLQKQLYHTYAKGVLDFSFIVKKDSNYLVEYKDMPGKFQVGFFEINEKNEKIDLEVAHWKICNIENPDAINLKKAKDREEAEIEDSFYQ